MSSLQWGAGGQRGWERVQTLVSSMAFQLPIPDPAWQPPWRGRHRSYGWPLMGTHPLTPDTTHYKQQRQTDTDTRTADRAACMLHTFLCSGHHPACHPVCFQGSWALTTDS